MPTTLLDRHAELLDLQEDLATESRRSVNGRIGVLATAVFELHEQIDDDRGRNDSRFDQIDERFNQVDSRFDQVDARFDRMDDRFDRMDDRFDRVELRLGAVEIDLAGVKTDLAEVKTDVAEVKTDLAGVKTELAKVAVSTEEIPRMVAGLEELRHWIVRDERKGQPSEN